MSLVVVLHAASTTFLSGMIWTIQVVHYPLFARVGRADFAAAMSDHGRRITGVIVAPWALQGATTVWLVARPPAGVSTLLVWSAAVLAAVPVVVTLVASVPAHRELGEGFDPSVHSRLLATNWLRTVAWTAHAAVAFAMVFRAAAS